MSLIKKEAVVLTGGIGDVLTIDSYLTAEDRSRIKKIYWASKTQKLTRQLLKAAKSFPNADTHVTAWDQFEFFHCFGKAKALKKFREPPEGYEDAQDLSIANVFRDIVRKQVPFTGSSLLPAEIADIKKFHLPKEYVCVVPGTNNDNGVRDFGVDEWYNVLKWLKHTGQTAVIVGPKSIQTPFEVKWALNLIGKTSLPESVEILKHAYGYVGVDTWLSVLATELFGPERLAIKSKNSHLYQHKSIYYAPHQSFDFITDKILPMRSDPVLSSYPSTGVGENVRWAYLHDLYYQPEVLNLVPYDEKYFKKYVVYEKTPIGRDLLTFRSDLVKKYCADKPVLDIGIGSGAFIKHHETKVYGFDICETAIKWLKKKKIYTNPWLERLSGIEGYCFWDSLEHIAQPSLLLSALPDNVYVFLSIPIIPPESQVGTMENLALWLYNWKHFRPNEHLHYWTAAGLKRYMATFGFRLAEESTGEVSIGRQDIGTFVFVNHPQP